MSADSEELPPRREADHSRAFIVEIPSLSDGRALTIGRYLSAVWRSKWIVIIVIGCFGLLSFGASFALAKKYRATVTMIPAEIAGESPTSSILGNFGGLAALAGVNFDSSNTVKDEGLAILESRSFVEKFLNDYDLVAVFDEPNLITRLTGAQPTMGDAYDAFVNDVLRVTEGIGTGVLSMSVTWKDREAVADWANTLYRRVNEEMRTRTISEATRNLEFLEKEIARTNIEEMRDILYSLVEQQMSNIMLANVNEDYAFRLIDVAHVPEPNEFASPIREIWLAIGLVIGAAFGSIIALMRDTK